MEGSLVAYKVFTNGSTLQASEVNENLMRQSVAVFSNAAARTAAITSPVEGQMTYLEDTDQYASWNGSSWVSPFGLTLLKKQTIGTAVNSVTVTDAFSSSYENYKIIISGGTCFSANQVINFRLGSTTSNYAYSLIFSEYNNSVGSLGSSSATSFVFAGSGTTDRLFMDLDVNSPFLAKNTQLRATWSSPSENGQCSGRLADSSSYSSFTILTAGANTMTGGNIYVYGYRSN
jgi:hypothetical protein